MGALQIPLEPPNVAVLKALHERFGGLRLVDAAGGVVTVIEPAADPGALVEEMIRLAFIGAMAEERAMAHPTGRVGQLAFDARRAWARIGRS